MIEGGESTPRPSIAFTAFDDFFYGAADDTEPEDSAWLNPRDSPTRRACARQLLAMACAEQAWVG
jgi:hypothetical protein